MNRFHCNYVSKYISKGFGGIKAAISLWTAKHWVYFLQLRMWDCQAGQAVSVEKEIKLMFLVEDFSSELTDAGVFFFFHVECTA